MATPDELMMKQSKDTIMYFVTTHPALTSQSSDEEKEVKRSLFASYLQEIALAKIVLLGWGLKEMAWLRPSLALSPDVWPASDPEPGLGRKAEGGQERVGSPGWAPPLGPR